jgi:hypothetical protein
MNCYLFSVKLYNSSTFTPEHYIQWQQFCTTCSLWEWIVAVLQQVQHLHVFGHGSNTSLGSQNSCSLATASLAFLHRCLLSHCALHALALSLPVLAPILLIMLFPLPEPSLCPPYFICAHALPTPCCALCALALSLPMPSLVVLCLLPVPLLCPPCSAHLTLPMPIDAIAVALMGESPQKGSITHW